MRTVDVAKIARQLRRQPPFDRLTVGDTRTVVLQHYRTLERTYL